MNAHSRREFLAGVGKGMLVGSVGTALFHDLELGRVEAGEVSDRLTFGKLEPLVAMMQETPLNKLQPELVKKIKSGTDLKTLIAAGSLANARSFAGQDYTGFHTMMALAPAYNMAQQMPTAQAALPVLKVLYRNTQRIHQNGGRKKEILKPVPTAAKAPEESRGEWLQAATRSADYDKAERAFAAFKDDPRGEAFNHLQFAVQDEINVHRVVLAWRSWATLDLIGDEYAHALLRQSVRFCVNHEQNRVRNRRPEPGIRKVLPKLLDQYKLVSRPLGKKKADDAWVEHLAQTVYAANRDQGAEAVAAALAEGFDPEAVGEALSLAANLLLLHDPGRRNSRNQIKPNGSVHGDSVGVHASDSANAWRNIARVTDHRNTVASLVTGGYHTAGQQGRTTDDLWPLAEHREAVTTDDPKELLKLADAAIREKNQGRVCAAIHRYGQQGHDPKAAFNLCLRYATSEDGALHAEKYFHTAQEEFGVARPAFRWRQLTALARVTASEYGWKAPGHQQACELLGVKV